MTTSAPERLSTATSVAPAVVRVNLLPARFIEAAETQRAQRIALGLVAGALLVTGGLWFLAHQSVLSAQEQVDTAQARNAMLVAEAAQYSAVPQAYAAVQAGQTQLAAAMAPDVRWSFVLNDISLTIPPGVGLVSMAVTTNGSAPPPAADDAVPPSVIGNISYTGEAKTYPDVSAWLDSQAKQKIFTNVYLSQASQSGAEQQQTGTPPVVAFAATSDLTSSALSRRYTSPAG